VYGTSAHLLHPFTDTSYLWLRADPPLKKSLFNNFKMFFGFLGIQHHVPMLIDKSSAKSMIGPDANAGLYLVDKARLDTAVFRAVKESRWASTLAKFRDIPTIKGKSEVINHPKTTDQNLTSVLSLTISLINSQNLDEGPQLVAAVSSFMDYVMTAVVLDPVSTIKELKDTYSFYIGLMRGARIPSSGDYTYSYLTKSSYTKTQAALAPLLALSHRLYGSVGVDGGEFFCKIIVLLLQTYRVISVTTALNTDSITKPSTATYKPDDLHKEMETAMSFLPFDTDDFQEHLNSAVRQHSYKVSEKGGPNGPATRSATADARALVKDTKTFEAFCTLGEEIGMSKVVGNAVVMSQTETSMGSSRLGNPVNGRIHAIAELGGKTRLVAILDYYTQSVLSPIHTAIGACLKLIPMDGVYNQGKASKQVHSWTLDNSRQLYSFDLTAATDRLPIGIQQFIMSKLLGSDSAAAAWADLLVGRGYASPDGKVIKYAVGQPMGALSSFAIFDLTHHILVQVAATKAKFALPFLDYVIIGDDVCIANKDVADQYLILMNSLGVDINLSKSVVHADDLAPAGEIAKRLFISGVELSAIPVKLFAKLPRFGKLAVTVQEFLLGRGAVKADRSFVNFIAGAIDTESLLTLLKLNAAPGDVVGLLNTVGAISDPLFIANWSPNVTLTESDVMDAYTFTLISEQLKRLEALVRQTSMVEELVTKNVMDPDDLAKVASEGSDILSTMLAKLAKGGSMDRRHPMQSAAFDEARRVGRILSSLRSGTLSLARVAKLGLLDSLRNSIWTNVIDTEEERSQVTYSVFLSALNNLDRITSLPATDGKGKVIPRTLEFTIPILALSRSFSVYWKLGGGVHVNMVRSRVSSDAKENAAKVDSLLLGLTVLKGHPARGSSSAQAKASPGATLRK